MGVRHEFSSLKANSWQYMLPLSVYYLTCFTFLASHLKTYRAWCWEIDELVKCIPCSHKCLGLTPTTWVISWVWWSTLIIPVLGRWSVPVLLGVPDQWKSLFQEKVARTWQHQRLSFGLCWWVCTYDPPKPQTNYPEPDHVLFLQLNTVAKKLVIVVGVRQRLKGKRGGWSFRVGRKGGLPVLSGWRWSHRE